MKANFRSYPGKWGLTRPDASIDHRQVANLRVFLARRGAGDARARQSRSLAAGRCRPQELVAPGHARPGRAHIGIVSDAMAPAGGRRMVVHNIGAGTQVEDTIASYRITGRYRWLPDRLG